MISSGTVTVQPPLSRRGKGPPLILLVSKDLDLSGHAKTLDPPPLKKWAEEGYAIVQLTCSTDDEPSSIRRNLVTTVEELRKLPSCEWAGKLGVITYFTGPVYLPDAFSGIDEISAIVSFGSSHEDGLDDIPSLAHISGRPEEDGLPEKNRKSYFYPEAEPLFVLPASPSYRPSSAAVAHTRALTFLKPILGGPYFDLEAIWEEHTKFEFADRSVEATMATMVDEPYVNHVPTITGGIGRARLTDFYRHHFIFSNPDDTKLGLVSRTVGIDRVIDEFLFELTHDRVIDWLVPGIPPTGKHISVPFTSVVNIRGDKLFHEHIAWDQATVLRQLGLLPEYLPFPYPLPDGSVASPGKRLEYRLPVAGVETAQKLMDENVVESNQMFTYAIREVDE